MVSNVSKEVVRTKEEARVFFEMVTQPEKRNFFRFSSTIKHLKWLIFNGSPGTVKLFFDELARHIEESKGEKVAG